jgi:hypothetical protein
MTRSNTAVAELTHLGSLLDIWSRVRKAFRVSILMALKWVSCQPRSGRRSVLGDARPQRPPDQTAVPPNAERPVCPKDGRQIRRSYNGSRDG